MSGRYTVREGSDQGNVSTSGGPGVGRGVPCFYSGYMCLGDDSLIKINPSAGVLNQKIMKNTTCVLASDFPSAYPRVFHKLYSEIRDHCTNSIRTYCFFSKKSICTFSG